MSDYIVAMKAIKKSFNDNKVIHGVDFFLKKGSIHALLGENGTGKTTLMNILGGVINSDSGEIICRGEKASIYSPADAVRYNIAFIHQELTVVNDLKIYENLFLGHEIKNNFKLDKKTMLQKSSDVLNRMGIDINPNIMAGELDASYKQIIEIAGALLKDAEIIIMDEPTASLNDTEIDNIFRIMKVLKTQGISFVFISHKLNEVIKICDYYTVMRDGKIAATGELTEDINESKLTKYMVGKEVSFDTLYRSRELGSIILETKSLTRHGEFENINLNLHKGEILGVTGLLGDGRSELFRTIYGCNSKYEGQIFVNGKKLKMTSTATAKKSGLSYLPSNRKENGIIKDMSISGNMSLSILKQLKGFAGISKKKELVFNYKYVRELSIKLNNLKDSITSLSGGNQQKVILAKTLSTKPDILILDNPTQGVDIAAKFEIYSIIMKLAESGMSILVLSSEAQEILMLCDRMYIMYHGKIRKEFKREEASQEKIMLIATGGVL